MIKIVFDLSRPWVKPVLDEMGIPKDSHTGRDRFERMMEDRRSLHGLESFREIRRGWCFGEESFREELHKSITEKVGPNHQDEERRETAEVWTERVLEEALREQGLRAEELGELRTNDPKKVDLAMRLRADTTMTASWIAEKLAVTSVGHLHRLLYLKRRKAANKSQ
ncbi:MAG: hypothetical protein AAB676_09365 [Verrucomicrobiota bacterium]